MPYQVGTLDQVIFHLFFVIFDDVINVFPYFNVNISLECETTFFINLKQI